MQFDERKEGIDPLTYSTYYSVCFCGSCARMIAANMMTHPRIFFSTQLLSEDDPSG